MDYQTFVKSRLLDPSSIPTPPETIQQMHMAMGLSGEVGEIVELVKKAWCYQRELDRGHLVSELGDVLYYLMGLASLFGITYDEIVKENVAKLEGRHPDGFSGAWKDKQ